MVDIEVPLVPRVVGDQQFAGKMARVLLKVAGHPGPGVNGRTSPVSRSTRQARQFSSPADSRKNTTCRLSRIQTSAAPRLRSVTEVTGRASWSRWIGANPQVEHAVNGRPKRNAGAV